MLLSIVAAEDWQLRSACRERLEALEYWLRRLIDDQLRSAYGDYFAYVDHSGNRLLRRKLIETVIERRRSNPGRYARDIDAILLEDAIDIVCNPELFSKHFRQALSLAFPEGAAEARTFLCRLLSPRNALAHANPISIRQAEQVICYSNDIIDSLKCYYTSIGEQRMYNSPEILRFVDSFGASCTRSALLSPSAGSLIALRDKDPSTWLRPGETLAVEVEIDPAFSEDSYTISWMVLTSKLPEQSSKKLILPITEAHVGELLLVECIVSMKRSWHRHGSYDDKLTLMYKVLPPLSGA